MKVQNQVRVWPVGQHTSSWHSTDMWDRSVRKPISIDGKEPTRRSLREMRGMFGSHPKVATSNLSHATTPQAYVWFIATLVACHTFLVIRPTSHRLKFLPNLATLVVAILLATFFVAATVCLRLVVAKLVMNQTSPRSENTQTGSHGGQDTFEHGWLIDIIHYMLGYRFPPFSGMNVYFIR